ncbi:MAG: 2-phosphoglycerate kinase, partial [Candidatus Hodarchaeota archaeon]
EWNFSLLPLNFHQRFSVIIIQELENQNYRKEADNYRAWQRIRKEKLGIVVLIGGVTGIGKSTIAKELSYRLGIHNTIGTDSIREVMRKTVSREVAPELHESSFLAQKHVEAPPVIDRLILGFERQCFMVSVGINGIIERSKKEGINGVLEGIHIIPGYFKTDLGVFPYILQLTDIEAHKERIYSRSDESRGPPERYLRHIDSITSIQRYIQNQAKAHDVPVIENIDAEKTINYIIEDIIEQLKKQLDQ